MANIVKDNAGMEFPLQIIRQYPAPVDSKEIWYDLTEAEEYAKNGATSYVGQTIKVVETKGDVITVTSYTIQGDGTLKTSSSEAHTHNAIDIVETAEKRFVSDEEKKRWSDTYTISQVDEKFKVLVQGMEFRGTFETEADLPTEECKDGWYAFVVNDPKYEYKNIMFIYEAKTSKWTSLGEILVPGLATQEKDGLMSKEDKAKVDNLDKTISELKTELETKITTLEEKHDSDKQTIDTSISKIDSAYKEADTKLQENLDTAKTELQESLNTAKTELEEKISEVDAKFITATSEEIESLFDEEV